MTEIDLKEYDYDLPDERIALYPVEERDLSQLLIYKGKNISKDVFRNLIDYLPSDSLLVFNNTRVIRARILFNKTTGASIELLCLEPITPSQYELSFSSYEPVEWKCIIGNLKKWKAGCISTPFIVNGKKYKLSAERLLEEEDTWRIRFSWNCSRMSFAQVIENVGHVPLPPYIKRNDEETDISRYQTVYSSIKGSVAAPTAGLHFSEELLKSFNEKGLATSEITLHVGAGTFRPIKSSRISDHMMHCEQFSVSRHTIELLKSYHTRIIAVGTTSVRTLESLYWLGVKLMTNDIDSGSDLKLGQWEAYYIKKNVSVEESMIAILKYLDVNNFTSFNSSTSIMIIPGYGFKMINGMITNFHQPKSTLLLLISAWIGDTWKDIYKFALENNFRFLSYGDSSLLFK